MSGLSAPARIIDYGRRWLRDLLVNGLAASTLATPIIRIPIYRAYGVAVKSHNIHPGCFFDTANVSIGQRTVIWNNCYFGDGVTIGDDCAIARDVAFQTTSHEIASSRRRVGRSTTAPIVVGSGTWIGTRVTVLPGVTIGNGCVIGAGAVVTRDC